MKVRARFLRPFSDMVGSGEVTVELADGTTVQGLLETLAKRHPALRKGAFEKDGRVTDYISGFINDKPMAILNGTDTVLNDGDEVLLFMPVSGG